MGAAVGRGHGNQFISVTLIECPDHEKVREPFDVSEARLKLGENYEHCFFLMYGSRAFWNARGVAKGAADKSDGLRREQGRSH